MGTLVIPLHGRPKASNWVTLETDVWRVVDGSVADLRAGVPTAVLLQRGGTLPAPAALYLSRSRDVVGPGPTLHLPASLGHVAGGDVVVIASDGSRIDVAWKGSATHNSLLLTERCDNYCIMCSQPPKERNDAHLFGRAERIISALPVGATHVGLTGGEPTLDADRLLHLLKHTATVAPDLGIHLLSNGRRFADLAFAQAFAGVPVRDLMVGIPIYGPHATLHDFVVQAEGAFNETVKGVLNLGQVGGRIEIRVVLQRHTIPVLKELALFIARNLPFVEQVALMGLEMTGLARPNASLVWVDPFDYRAELVEAYKVLSQAGVATYIYNHQLCVLDESLWHASVQSISDWKNDYPELCAPCDVREWCAGVFTTSGNRLSEHLAPVSMASAQDA